MRFDDSIAIKALFYDHYYAVVGSQTYIFDETTETITDEIANIDVDFELYDDKGYPLSPEEEWVDLSKCFISFNSSAGKVRLNDGNEYIYTYYVIFPLKKSIYHLIPREGDYVHITKADGTVDCEMQVKGFVTYKKRYAKIWL